MRHPFAGIIAPDQKPADQPEIQTTRRNLFGLAAGVVAAGTVGAIALSSTQAQAQRGQPTTLMVGEEGGRPPGRPNGPVTRARGEQGQRRGWKK
jgi:hypothetical protein